jgi:hypothetical protein
MPEEIGPRDAELLLGEIPRQLREGRREHQRQDAALSLIGPQPAALDAMGDEVVGITPTPRGLRPRAPRNLAGRRRTRALATADAAVRHKPPTADATGPFREHLEMLGASAGNQGGPLLASVPGSFLASAEEEAEQQIITEYAVYDHRPSDSDLLIPAIEAHTQTFGRAPRVVAADAAFFSGANEAAAHALGVTRVCIPNANTTSAARKRDQKKRWFKNGQKWRTGCEGRISVVKRRHGLNRSRYKGEAGMKRWVGLGVIADNLINIGRVLATRPSP